jgi:oligoendopeptidase F
MTKKIFALFLVLALLFTGCGQQPSLSESSGISSESTPPKGTHFSELVYTAPDLDETIQAYKTYAQKIQSAASAEEVISVWKDEAAFSKNYYDMYTLSYILFSLDTSNTQNSDQYEYMQEFLSKIKPAAMDFTRALCSSAYRPKLEKAFGENVLQSMQISVDQYTDEQLDLELQESKLSTEYVKLNSDKTVFETDEHAFTTSDLYYLVYSGDEENKQIAKSLLNEYYLDINRQSGEIFTQLVDVRTKIAKSAGFSNYLDYYYHNTSLSGYARSDVENFRASVKKYRECLLKYR